MTTEEIKKIIGFEEGDKVKLNVEWDAPSVGIHNLKTFCALKFSDLDFFTVESMEIGGSMSKCTLLEARTNSQLKKILKVLVHLILFGLKKPKICMIVRTGSS